MSLLFLLRNPVNAFLHVCHFQSLHHAVGDGSVPAVVPREAANTVTDDAIAKQGSGFCEADGRSCDDLSFVQAMVIDLP